MIKNRSKIRVSKHKGLAQFALTLAKISRGKGFMQAALLEASVVRFRSEQGEVFGAGFMVGPQHFLTCAHVIAAILQVPDTQPQAPTESIFFDFPLLEPGYAFSAQVVGWLPRKDESGDIALLKVSPGAKLPMGAKPVLMMAWKAQQEYLTYGFVERAGTYARGVILGRQADGLIYMEGKADSGAQIGLGFSGAPVCDSQYNAVVGMIVAKGSDQTRAAYMLDGVPLQRVFSGLTLSPRPELLRQQLREYEQQLQALKPTLEEKQKRLRAKEAAQQDIRSMSGLFGGRKKANPLREEVEALEQQAAQITSEIESIKLRLKQLESV